MLPFNRKGLWGKNCRCIVGNVGVCLGLDPCVGLKLGYFCLCCFDLNCSVSITNCWSSPFNAISSLDQPPGSGFTAAWIASLTLGVTKCTSMSMFK